MTTPIMRGFALLLLAMATVHAQVPGILSYQGRVAVGTVNFDGSGAFKFAFVNADGTVTYWSNDGTSTAGSEPTAAVALTVTKGLYSVLLGDTSAPLSMTAIPNSVFANPDVRLRVWFNDGANGSQLLTPDQRIAAVGYALMADTVTDGAITAAKIATGAVGSTQIATGAVGATQLADGTITADKLAKPMRSGSIPSSSMSFDAAGASFVVPFAPAFGTVPIVTLSLEATPTTPAAAASVSVTARTTGQFSATISASGLALPPVTLDGFGSNDTGFQSSMTVVNGNPAISYSGETNLGLKYIRATNPSGTSWGPVVNADSIGDLMLFSSLAVVNGNPAISYSETNPQDLKYVRATDTSGANWGTPVTLDSAGNVGAHTSLAVVNGNPAICYQDQSNGDLKYVRATDASGTSWGTPVTLDSVGNVGEYTSLAVVNGNPAISYYDQSNGDLKYVRATSTSGTLITDWGTPVTLDSAGIVGRYTSLAVVNGNPAISYSDVSNGDLKYVRATTTSGTLITDWGTPVTLDSAGIVGRYTSLAVVNGNPAISYSDVSNSALKYVRATDASGTLITDWGTPVTLDNDGSVGQDTSLAVVNGNPAISYFDYGNADLKYVRAPDPDGADWPLAPFTIQWIALEP